MRFIIRSVITALALWLTTQLPLDVVVEGGAEDSFWGKAFVFVGVAAILVLVNMVVKPIITILTLPVQILTLGLFSLIVSWAMLVFAAWITSHFSFGTLDVGGFWKTLLAAIVISITASVIAALTPGVKR